MKPASNQSLEMLLTLRAVFFAGNKYVCPCCGWKLRAFTHGNTSVKLRDLGYCPRCNAKSRHRRWWLFLQEHTNIFSSPIRLFQFSPNYCLSRQFSRMPNIDYLTGDLRRHRNIRILMGLPAAPLPAESFDVVLCIHALEHIQDDRQAMREIYRMLKPGGWAGVSSPMRLDQLTYEDASITSKAERKKAFGEPVHVRIYGRDLNDRLQETGFTTKFYPGKDIDPLSAQKYGLRDDENIFICTKE